MAVVGTPVPAYAAPRVVDPFSGRWPSGVRTGEQSHLGTGPISGAHRASPCTDDITHLRRGPREGRETSQLQRRKKRDGTRYGVAANRRCACAQDPRRNVLARQVTL